MMNSIKSIILLLIVLVVGVGGIILGLNMIYTESTEISPAEYTRLQWSAEKYPNSIGKMVVNALTDRIITESECRLIRDSISAKWEVEKVKEAAAAVKRMIKMPTTNEISYVRLRLVHSIYTSPGHVSVKPMIEKAMSDDIISDDEFNEINVMADSIDAIYQKKHIIKIKREMKGSK